MKSTFIILCALCIINFANAQSYDGEKQHFLIEIETFSPPTQAMVKSFIGATATPIQAKSLNDKDVAIGSKGAKVTLLYFMPESGSGKPNINNNINTLISKNKKKNLSVIAFSNESREALMNRAANKENSFPIIPNARMLSEAVYGSELGYPRLFVLDNANTIVAVLPEEFIVKQSDLNQTLQTIIDANK